MREIRPAESAAGQIGVLEVDAAQASLAQIGSAKHNTAKIPIPACVTTK